MNFDLFKGELEKNNFSHSYIFEGDVQFLDSVRFFLPSKILNSSNDFKMESEIKNGTHPDLLLIDSEKNRISIDEIRNLIEYVQKKPIHSKYKLVMINNGEKLGVEASNALLKTLEESFDYVIICFLVENRYRLLNTIQSRCVFVTSTNYSDNIKYEDYPELLSILDAALKGDFMALYSTKNRDYLLTLKEDENFIKMLYNFFKDFYMYLITKSENFDINILKIFQRNENYNLDKISKILDTIESVGQNLKNNVNFQLSIEKIFVDILK